MKVVTDGWWVYPGFIPDGDLIVSKTYMTRVEGETQNKDTPLLSSSGQSLQA
jgi:IS1 family transposase